MSEQTVSAPPLFAEKAGAVLADVFSRSRRFSDFPSNALRIFFPFDISARFAGETKLTDGGPVEVYWDVTAPTVFAAELQAGLDQVPEIKTKLRHSTEKWTTIRVNAQRKPKD